MPKVRSIGKLIDNAMKQLMLDNESLLGTLPTNIASESVDQRRLGELIGDLRKRDFGNVELLGLDQLQKQIKRALEIAQRNSKALLICFCS